MNNSEIYISCFKTSLSIDQENWDNLEYNSVPEWDSIGHMSLIAELEEKFKISIDTDDIVDFSSFKKGKTILKKYKVEF
ncbi:MAG: acyl carrier protein [Candidatus Pelagibacter sp. TMED273]|nr:MAG: acyl carrier protein [Candidatus Pelagibacter sp. TMED273]|tara:strand:- start:220 stop:456 length:237 start_codon:yes stop_codon:yes gene_type:complete